MTQKDLPMTASPSSNDALLAAPSTAPASGPAGAATTFEQHWRNATSRYPDHPFLVFSEPDHPTQQWSYAEFDELVARTAERLRGLGVRQGDGVHLALRNSPAFLALWLAVSRLGAWIVPVDPASSARDIASQLRRTRPRVGVYSHDRAEAYRAGAVDAGIDAQQLIGVHEDARDTQSGSALLAEQPLAAEVAAKPSPSDRLAIMFTSGTTSEPKGVVLTQRNYAYVAEQMSSIIALQSRHRWLVTLPLFHANAQFYCFGPAIVTGASVALTSAFSASRWLAQAAQLQVTHASLFAAPIRMILARRPQNAPRLQLEHVWFAQSLGEQHYQDFAELTGVPARQLYGMTETTAVVTADLGPEPGRDVIGAPLPGRDVLLLDPDTARPTAPGEPGVITVRGERGVDLFDGYLDTPEATARSFSSRGGQTWFSTGDLARADTSGVLRFVGRIDDVIKVAGENTSLTEIEAALAQAPGVLEVAVIAQPDPVRDVVPVAFVVPRDWDNPPSIDEFTAWALQNLTPASRPREWTLIRQLPRTSVGKLRRFQLTSAQDARQPDPERASV